MADHDQQFAILAFFRVDIPYPCNDFFFWCKKETYLVSKTG